jgi:hypothetical protein
MSNSIDNYAAQKNYAAQTGHIEGGKNKLTEREQP